MASASAHNTAGSSIILDDRKPSARNRVIDLTDNVVDLISDDEDDDDIDTQMNAFARLNRRKQQVDADKKFAASLAFAMVAEGGEDRQKQMEIDAAFAKSIQEEEERNLKRRNEIQDAKIAAIAKKKARKKDPPAIVIKPVGTIAYSAPHSLTAPEEPFEPVRDNPSSVDECACCLEKLDRNVVKSKICPHHFHDVCIRDCLKLDLQCPICRRAMEEPKRGTSPSATMAISVTSQDCSGFAGAGTIHIKYSIPGGHQSSFHIRPGTPFKGLEHSTILPNNNDGRGLMKRISYAFKRGLLFDVVRDNVNEPGVIPTPSAAACTNLTESLTSTSKTWSDPAHFQKCHKILDDMKMPTSDALCHNSNFSSFDLDS